jgi:hypothetical protein
MAYSARFAGRTTASAAKPSRTSGRHAALAVVFALLLGAIGCTPGIAWSRFTYDEGFELAQREGKPVFVYFRAWWMVECTRFEDDVLKDPAVINVTSDLVCVPLNFDYEPDRKLAESWGITRPPAYAMIAPNGELLGRGEGLMSVTSVVLGIQAAKDKYVLRPMAPR